MKVLANSTENGGENSSSVSDKKKDEVVDHYPFLFDSDRDCVYCSSQTGHEKKRKRSNYGCKECDVRLCVYPCFGLFHQSVNRDA